MKASIVHSLQSSISLAWAAGLGIALESPVIFKALLIGGLVFYGVLSGIQAVVNAFAAVLQSKTN